MRLLSLFLLINFMMMSQSAAAVAVFPVSVFSQDAGVTNGSNAIGAADGAGALIGDGSTIVLQFDDWVAGDTVTLNTLANGLVAGGAISIGSTSTGTAVFSVEQVFNTLFTTTHNFDFSSDCALLSSSGCNLIRIRTTGVVFSSGILLDGVVSSAPEPGVWALAICGFGLVAWRLKQLRRREITLALKVA